jgi:hypothetical protein
MRSTNSPNHKFMYTNILIKWIFECTNEKKNINSSYHDFLDRGLLLNAAELRVTCDWLSWSPLLESFTVAIMTWITATDYLCNKLPRICSVCRNHNPVLPSFMTYHWGINWERYTPYKWKVHNGKIEIIVIF